MWSRRDYGFPLAVWTIMASLRTVGRQLVQEQHPHVGQAHLAGVGRPTSSDEPGRRHGVVRGSEWPPRYQTFGREQASHAPDPAHLDGLSERQRRQDRGQPAREERLAGAGRTDQQHVVDDSLPTLEAPYLVIVGRP